MLKNLQKNIIQLLILLGLMLSTEGLYANSPVAIEASDKTSKASNASKATDMLQRARQEANQGNLKEAVGFYQKTLRLDGNQSEARKELSDLLVKLHLEDPYSEDPSHFLHETYLDEDSLESKNSIESKS